MISINRRSVFVLILFGTLASSGCARLETVPADTGVITQEVVSSRVAVQNLYRDAGDAFAAGNAEQASALLERALRIEPNNAYLWFGLAKLAKYNNQYEKAQDFSKRALSFVGNNSGLKKQIDLFERGL